MAKSIFKTISEMLGRVEATPRWFNSLNRYDAVGYDSLDYSKPNFSLSRAVYYASVVSDGVSTVGEKYLLGSVYGKPIINSVCGFAFAQPFSIKVGGDSENETAYFVNEWVKNNYPEIFEALRYSMRDGVSYLRVKDDLSPKLIPGERTTIKVDPVTGEVIGFDVNVNVQEDNATSVEYRTEYRKDSPYIRVIKIKDSKETVLEEVTGDDGQQPLEVIAFHNEKEPSFVYGISEFQNIYYLMANYHSVMSKAIKNNIFNSDQFPYISGIDNVNTFLMSQGERQADGSYKIDWDAHKILLGGKDFKVDMISPIQNAGEAEKLLNLLFWAICQTSETPEFVMGTAVSSSKASVQEQMPIVLRKADRKRKQYEQYIRELVSLIMYKGSKLDSRIKILDDYTVVFPDIVDDDMNVKIELVKFLSDEGLISDKTKATLLGLEKYVDDINEELANAYEEKKKADEEFAKSIKLANEPSDELNKKDIEQEE